MLITLFLSADSAVAAAFLRLCGVSRRDLNHLCCTMGLADGTALLLGSVLRNSTAAAMKPPPDLILLAGSILCLIFVVRSTPNHPRITSGAVAVLFSLDNFIAGTRIGGLGRAALCAACVALFSLLFCRIAFESADLLIARIRRRRLFRLAAGFLRPHSSFSLTGTETNRSFEEVRCRL
jgi:hypothetical protein